MLLVAITVSVGAWAGWGVYGWAVVMFAFALFLLYRCVALLLGRAPKQVVSSDDQDQLVAVSGPVDQFEAELMSQALDAEGMPATYGGRPNPDGMIPGGGLRWSKTRVAVRKRDATRASELLGGIVQAPSEDDPPPVAEPDVDLSAVRSSDPQGLEAALAVFGTDSSQSRPWRRFVRWVRG